MGAVATMVVELTMVNVVAGLAGPKSTALASVKFGAGDRDRGPARDRARSRAHARDDGRTGDE